MSSTTSRLTALRERREQLEAKIAKLQTREKSQARKDDTRLKILIGAAMLADAELHSQTNDLIRVVLKRGITALRDQEFLAMKSWL